MDNLLNFIFGLDISKVHESQSDTLGEQCIKLFEEAAKAESVEVVANKKPLAAALKALDIDADVPGKDEATEAYFSDYSLYCRAVGILKTDAIELGKLAEMGWVLACNGDQAMANEPAQYKLSFIRILSATDEPSEATPPDLEKLRKTAQKDATEPFKRSKTLKSPVKENSAKKIADQLLEVTMAGAIPAFPDAGSQFTGKVPQPSKAALRRKAFKAKFSPKK